MNGHGDTGTTAARDDLVTRLAVLDPVDEADVPLATREDRRDLRDAFVTQGTVVALQHRRRPRGVGGLVAAALVALVAGGGALVAQVPGGLSGVVAAAGVAMDPDRVDRDAERAEYRAWVDQVVTCLQDQHGDAVQPVDGGYELEWNRLAATADGSRTFGDTSCQYEAGDPPRPAPLTDRELERFWVEQVALASCLRGLGHEVSTGQSRDEFAATWRDPAPAAPPWTPYADVPVGDLLEAQERCGVPQPAAPPAWATGDAPALELGRAGVDGRRAAAAVAFVSDEDWLRTWAQCLTDLGAPATSEGDTLTSEGHDVALDHLCADRYRAPQNRTISSLPYFERQYAHEVERTVPCLRERGVQVPDPPTFEAYLRGADTGPLWRSWSFVTADDIPDRDARDALERACPPYPPQDQEP